jgi:16S rRNA (cytosine967-C5)-methyltransferase
MTMQIANAELLATGITILTEVSGALKNTARAMGMANELLTDWLERQQKGDAPPIDRSVAAGFRDHKELNSGERRWITSVVYGTVRALSRQQYLLAALNREVTAASLISLWVEEHENEPTAALKEALETLPAESDPGAYLRICLSIPDPIAASIEQQLSAEEVLRAGSALNCQAPTVLRINTLRTRKNRVMEKIPGSAETNFSPIGLTLPGRIALHAQPGFKEGWFELQEEASQLAALLTNAAPGMTVVDVGAGGGGKSLAMAAMMRNSGRIVAIDSAERRLNELSQRAVRAHAYIIQPCCPALGAGGQWQTSLGDDAGETINGLKNSADVVLIDAPCSGSGTMRRTPDIRWRYNDLKAFSAVQATLIKQGSLLVKPGGALVYITCALEQEQNEEIVQAFLASPEGADFTLENGLACLVEAAKRAAINCMGQEVGGKWEPQGYEELFTGPYLRTWPHRHGMDGFFAARLVRRS